MLAVKIYLEKENRDQDFLKELSKIAEKIGVESRETMSIVSDNSTIEIVSGNENTLYEEDAEIVVEVLVKKKLYLSKSDFKEKFFK